MNDNHSTLLPQQLKHTRSLQQARNRLKIFIHIISFKLYSNSVTLLVFSDMSENRGTRVQLLADDQSSPDKHTCHPMLIPWDPLAAPV